MLTSFNLIFSIGQTEYLLKDVKKLDFLQKGILPLKSAIERLEEKCAFLVFIYNSDYNSDHCLYYNIQGASRFERDTSLLFRCYSDNF